eukprot:CAMPEP_0117682646 /NCGR_PEP_ID=MMETSP0804-20121206/19817_1 /TAXON_ID=1074897 /ORGANISM="Tetraselmis astigmatica, Strain CCMP880" /LENGTH=104 /DNA_ID=CAMNT_0005492865 /DNA_START=420 /DNA_END=734 /DNA_ORIENTATION=+
MNRDEPSSKVYSGKPPHMRWRDKIAFLEQLDGRDPKTTNRRASDSDSVQGDLEMRVEASSGSKTKTRTYTESFTHHPQHIRFRDKVAILRGDKPVTVAAAKQAS